MKSGWIVLLAMAASITFAGCGGNGSVQNPPPPPPSQLSIAFQAQPGSSIPVSSSENVTAVVSNDPTNSGVDWTLTCQSDPNNQNGLCGSISPLHTASGSATTYTAPTAISINSTVVEIVAFATDDKNHNVDAPITITSFDSGLSGTFVLQLNGVDGGFNPYQFAGVVTLDGNGGISTGEQTVNFLDPVTFIFVSKADSIISTGSSYFIGNDGRGTITLNPNNDADIGSETFSVVFLSPNHLLIDALSTNNLTISGAGTMDLQQGGPQAPAGGYAFVVRGAQLARSAPLAFGGVFNIDSPNTISGNGSVADEILDKKLNATAAPISGTLTAPDQFGAVTLNLSAGFGKNGKLIPIQFTGYIIDSTHIQLIESDDNLGSGFALTAGPAIGQGSATGTFKDNTAFSGNYVFDVLGTDLSNLNLAPSTLTTAAVLAADGSGNLTSGFMDTFLALNTVQGTSGAQISATFNGTYSVDASGSGRTALTLTNFNPNPTRGYLPTLFFYLTGSGSQNTPLVLEAGDSHYPSLGTGVGYAQSPSPTFGGDYGMIFTQQQFGFSENDGTAQMTVDPTANSLAGFADVNLDFGTNLDQPFTGNFSSPAASGVFAGTLVGTNNNLVSSVAFFPPIAVNFYAVDANHGFFIETDLLNAVPPQEPGQVSLGYYVTRIPVCSTCP